MRYLNADEIKNTRKEEAHGILDECSGHLVKLNSGITNFKIWHKSLFKGDNSIKILDLGTGSGTFAYQLKEIGCANLSGADIDDYRQDQFKSLYKEFKTADLSWDAIPWSDKTFDIVTSWCTLPHLENPFYCVREAHRILKDNGIFMFSVPHVASHSSISYFVKNKNFPHYRDTNNHIVIFTDAIVRSTILKYFDLIDMEYAIRPKIFRGGVKSKLRGIGYNLINKYFPKLGKGLRRRWAYDVIYTLRKK